MIEFYAPVRSVHIAAVVISGSLFALRGMGVLADGGWPRHIVVRAASWAVDTVLLTAALMLWTMLPEALFANHWLAVKLLLLVVYVGFGSLVLRREGTKRGRAMTYFAALAVYVFMIGIARLHDPMGWLTLL